MLIMIMNNDNESMFVLTIIKKTRLKFSQQSVTAF